MEPLNEYSDCCSIAFFLLLTSLVTQKTQLLKMTPINHSMLNLKFGDKKVEEFTHLLRLKQNDCQQCVDNIETITDINGATNTCIISLQDFTLIVFGKTRNNSQTKENNHLNKKPWFNTECYNARKCFNNARNNFLRNKVDVDLRNIYISVLKLRTVKSKLRVNGHF